MDKKNSNQFEGGQNPEAQIKKLKKSQLILRICCGILVLICAYLAFTRVQADTKMVEIETKNTSIEQELKDLLREHEEIKLQYGDLTEQLSEKDSLILANAEEIKKLIASQADYGQIKRKMERLQNISREYVEEIDRLYRENEELKTENTKVKGDLKRSQQENLKISEEKEELTTKVQTAAMLKAYSLRAQGVRAKSKGEEITDKASRTEVIRLNFIIAENSLTEPGPVQLFIRIAIPETKRVLTPNTSDLYSFFHNGQKLQYSVAKTIQYDGSAQSVSMEWKIDPADKVIKGVYTIALYSSDQFLGETTLELK